MRKNIKLSIAITAMFATTILAVPIEIKIKDDIVQKSITPLGINISQAGGGAPWGIRTDKIYFSENFEGTVYRQAHQGTLYEDGFTTEYVTKKGVDKWWGKLKLKEIIIGADALILSGPLKGEKRKIKKIAFRDELSYQRGKKVMIPKLFMVFDKPVKLPGKKPISKIGLMIQKDNSKTKGCTGQKKYDDFWISSNVELVHDDLFPGVFGYSALMLDATKEQTKLDKKTNKISGNGEKEAHFKCGVGKSNFINQNGKWIVKIKAKTLDNNASLEIKAAGIKNGNVVKIPITNFWKEFSVPMEISGQPVGGANGAMLSFSAIAKNGRVIIDDFICTKDVKYENPTIFNDEFVNTLKSLNPGIIRQLMMGGTMEERLSPKIESIRSVNTIVKAAGPYQSRKLCSWSLPEIYELAEYLDCEVWCSIPGTLYKKDVDLFMEYIGGPAGTKGGDMRIKHGHLDPWTESLKKIHVEVGNEAWNIMFGFIAGGYNGPDYWEDIFKQIKSSPYYKSNIVCHAAGQNYSSAMSERIMKDTPSADKYAIGPYQMHHLYKEDVETYKTDADFAKFAMIYPMKSCEYNGMEKQLANSKKYGKELSVYEMSWHLTGGDIDARNNKPEHPEVREMVNNFVVTTPAAMAHFNHMLRLVKDFGMRSLCHFTFRGQYFNVKLWGSVLNMSKGNERYRPMGLVFSMINECMKGDIVETEHSENQPTFKGVGAYPGAKKIKVPGKKKAVKELSENSMPYVYSYAFKDGTNHSLILMNFDLEKSKDVKISMEGSAKNVASKKIAPKNWEDNNEYDMGNGKNSVKIEIVKLPEFENGTVITIPAASIQTIHWTE